MIAKNEIRDGLVLYLESDELEAEGGVCTGADRGRVQGSYFFVCVAADGETGNWAPLFSEAGPYRELVPYDEKEGPKSWRESTTYFHETQVWQAPHTAVVTASIAAGDLSEAGARNRLSDAGIDLVYRTVFG